MKNRNKIKLPINFCTTGNFLNLKKMKLTQTDNKPRIKNSKQQLITLNNNKSFQNEEINKKDELIEQLQQRIKFLEKRINILEKNKSKSKNRSRNIDLNNLLILKTEKINNKKYNNNINSYSVSNKNINNNKNKTIIPLDNKILKTKLIKNKKNIFELIDLKKLKIFHRNNSFNKIDNNNNNSISNYTTYNNSSCIGSALKSKKKSIKLNIQNNKINSFHNLLYNISSTKNKISGEKMMLKKKINGINNIPKKERFNQNNSAYKIMLSSTNYTNYSNNVSNSFKEEININNTNNTNNIIINTSFNEIQNKLENIKKRTENLFEIFSSMHKSDNNKNKNFIIKKTNFPNNMNIKVNILEKIKKKNI